jgi:hypothetical protein
MMTSGTMHMGGHMAGAARLGFEFAGSCAEHLAYAGNPAVTHTRKWLAEIQPASLVFTTDRATPRPLERSP